MPTVSLLVMSPSPARGATYRAFPELTGTVGVDFGNDTFRIGPFASLSYATYSNATRSVSCASAYCTPLSDSSGIDDTSGHGWLMLGVRGSYLH